MHPETFSWTKSLITVITWNRYSFQVICLNMFPYNMGPALFSTHFANESSFLLGCPICLFFIQNHVLAFLHHRLDLLVQCLHIAAELVGDNNDLGSLFCITNVLCWWCLKSFLGIVNWFWISTLFFFFNQITGSLASQSFEFEFLSNCKEGIQIFLVNICLTKVEEVKDGQKVLRVKRPEVDQCGWGCLFFWRTFSKKGL